MMNRHFLNVCAVAVLGSALAGCSTGPDHSGAPSGSNVFVVPDDAKIKPHSISDGFAIFDHEGSTWVFSTTSDDVKEFMAGKELAKHVTRMKATPAGIMKVKAPDKETIDAYLDTTKKASSAAPESPRNTDTDSNLAIAARLAQDVQAGVVTSNEGSHKDIKPDHPVTVVPLSVTTIKPVAKKVITPAAVRSGFEIFNAPDATWVFTTNSKELGDYKAGKELAKHSTKLKATPGGIVKVKAPDQETIDAFLAAKSGFVTRIVDGHLWAFYEGSSEQQAVDRGAELAKHVTKLTNVAGKVQTIKAPSTDVLDAYVAATPGIATRMVDGYLWVFAPKSETLALVDAGSEPAKHVTKLMSVNGRVRTVRAGEMGVINAFLAAKPGFETLFIDGYTWVFKQGSPELHTVLNGGELAKHVTKMKAINGKVQTFKAPDTETLVAYMDK